MRTTYSGLGQHVLAEQHRHPQRQEGHQRLNHDHPGDRERKPIHGRRQGRRRRRAVDQLAQQPGHDQTDSAASAWSTSSATTADRRVRTILLKNAQTACRFATGKPRSGRRDDAKYYSPGAHAGADGARP